MTASSPVQGRQTIPRSGQRPVAVVDGSLTKNLNEIGGRLWAALALVERVARTCEPMMPVSSERPRNDAC
jgi:hypothetical protein